MDKLKGEFCYVQTRNGKIVSIHYSLTEDDEAINIKRGIAGAFQANFDKQKEVEELDPSSSHVSHYRYVHILLCNIALQLVKILEQFCKDIQ